MPRKVIKKQLKRATDDRRFWASNGSAISDLRELEAFLKSVSDEVFESHVDRQKNDFVNWIESVLEDAELARKLKRYKSKIPTMQILTYHLKKYYN